ncbi:hypothetical protein GCM10027343_14800 [Noviherbaspirillum agri]
MFDPSVIFQRTHEGRAEIKQKSHGLTQSERLVLIMVDGVSTYQQVRDKLPSLTDDRFNRGLRKLHQKELILEVFMPTEEAEAEHLEQEVIDRFLHQDALDPVTIIMFDPEDELGGISAPAVSPYQKLLEKTPSAAQPLPQLEPQWSRQEPAQPAPQTAPQIGAVAQAASEAAVLEPQEIHTPAASAESAPPPVEALDDVHKEMVDLLAEEVRQRNVARPARMAGRPEAPPLNILPPKPAERRSSSVQLHWGYWMMGIGATFIVGYFVL